jgi:hypothetical protein
MIYLPTIPLVRPFANGLKRRYLHLAGPFKLSNRVILKLFLEGLGGLGKSLTILKAGNNNYFMALL